MNDSDGTSGAVVNSCIDQVMLLKCTNSPRQLDSASVRDPSGWIRAELHNTMLGGCKLARVDLTRNSSHACLLNLIESDQNAISIFAGFISDVLCLRARISSSSESEISRCALSSVLFECCPCSSVLCTLVPWVFKFISGTTNTLEDTVVVVR
jgi:hypothetical protein